MRACVWKHMSDFVGMWRPEKDTGCFDCFLLYTPRCGLELEARACWAAWAIYMDAGETTLVLHFNYRAIYMATVFACDLAIWLRTYYVFQDSPELTTHLAQPHSAGI